MPDIIDLCNGCNKTTWTRGGLCCKCGSYCFWCGNGNLYIRNICKSCHLPDETFTEENIYISMV